MCKCKIYNAALLFVGLLAGVAAAVLFYFDLLPGAAAGLSAMVFLAAVVVFALVLGVLTGCKCMTPCNECQNSAVVFSACMAAATVLFAVAAIAVLDGSAVLTAVAVGLATFAFVALAGSVAVTVRYVTKPTECTHCQRETRGC